MIWSVRLGGFRGLVALSPAMASVIIVAITLSVAIAIAIYIEGLTSFTRLEKLDISTHYVKSDGSVVIPIRNTGSSKATIPRGGVMINGIPYNQFDPSATVLVNGTDLSVQSVTVDVGEYYEVEIRSTKFEPGVTYEVKICTASGKEYPRAILYGGVVGTPAPTTTQPPTTTPPPTTTSPPCFIATACAGSDSSWALSILRVFRDRVLSSNLLTRSLVEVYYRCSPPIADVLSSHKTLALAVRILLVYPAGLFASLAMEPYAFAVGLSISVLLIWESKLTDGFLSALFSMGLLCVAALITGYCGYYLRFPALIGACILPFIVPAGIASIASIFALKRKG